MTEAQRRELAYCESVLLNGHGPHSAGFDQRCVECASRLVLIERVLAERKSEVTPEENVVREFKGTAIENQRIRVTVERWSSMCEDFVHVFHAHGDDSVTDMIFTDPEARYLLAVLHKLYGSPKERVLAASAQPTNANWREAVGNLIDTLIGGQDSCQDCGEDDEPCPACAVSTMVIQSLEAILRGEPTERVRAEGEKEICLCAAIQMPDGYIFRGHRHDDCYLTMGGWEKYTKADGHAAKQGFLTSRGRFVDRAEAAKLHNVKAPCVSEDLW